jgi:AcrR family transcriptional regulator
MSSDTAGRAEPLGTRDRIFTAAREQFEARGFEVGMGEIARRAGISRQAVYLHFASKADLLRQLTTWVEEQADLGSLLEPVFDAPTGEEALRVLVHVAAVFEPQIHALARAVERIGSGDPQVRKISADQMRRRLEAMTGIVGRIQADGRLKPGWDVDRAAAFVWSTTAPAAYHLMVVELGWTPLQWADATYRLLHDAFITANESTADRSS